VADERRMGGREVAIVAVVAVAIVLGLEVVTTIVPGARDLLAGTPLLITVLIVGTAAMLWLIATRRTPDG
jgi:4-amino-4-deoxy-L-arabinose transferase-like glycosyltransferase